ncbi:cellulose biosynthesis protein BcsN [Inquilinus sp.]|jgi:hypothetical protein|uniref:cellulose biosynthesis protein BcsN n=1 Tax=Inquilinus sp. TaxID=1932117 RepID=UPI003782DF2E
MPLRTLLVLALAALATGCAPKGRFDPKSTTMLWREVPADRAALRLSGSLRPMLLAVSDRRGGETLEQRYVLRNDTRAKGENFLQLKISASGKATRVTSDQFLAAVAAPVGTVDANSIREGKNRYGPFLYVSGRPEGSPGCLFALQRLQRSLGATLPSGIDQADITLRLCDAVASPDDLVRLMGDWTIDPALGDATARLAAGN